MEHPSSHVSDLSKKSIKYEDEKQTNKIVFLFENIIMIDDKGGNIFTITNIGNERSYFNVNLKI